MTPFHHKIHHIKTILLNTKIFCEQLKSFLLRIRVKFYKTLTRNKKVTQFDSKLVFLKKTPSLMLTNHNKALFIILTNPNKVLFVKIKQKSENSRESACQEQTQYFQ